MAGTEKTPLLEEIEDNELTTITGGAEKVEAKKPKRVKKVKKKKPFVGPKIGKLEF